MFQVAIIRNEIANDHNNWIIACQKKKSVIEYDIIDITKNDWFKKVTFKDYKCYLAKPPCSTSRFKNLYDERIFIISRVLNKYVFPSYDEILIYENKRLLSYWLKAKKIPHPYTKVFYNKKEALDFVYSLKQFPIVSKLNIGAAGNGVFFLESRSKAIRHITRIFSKGILPRTGPKLKKDKFLRRAFIYLKKPKEIKYRLDFYRQVINEPQKGFILLQEYIPHKYEWRVVRIGDSFFAHKKIKKNSMASGSLLKEYDCPPIRLLDFVKKITDESEFYSQAVDILENHNGQYLVNELQCIFGQSDPFQMKINGQIGRFRHIEGNWIFEEGDFNTNKSYDLRLKHIIDVLSKDAGNSRF